MTEYTTNRLWLLIAVIAVSLIHIMSVVVWGYYLFMALAGDFMVGQFLAAAIVSAITKAIMNIIEEKLENEKVTSLIK